MDIRKLTEDFSVAAQLLPIQMEDVHKAGFRSVICNRPDGEEPGQPSYAEIKDAAGLAGLESRYIPVVPGLAGMAEVLKTTQALDDLPKPILAFCRSGARSEAMFNAAKANQP